MDDKDIKLKARYSDYVKRHAIQQESYYFIRFPRRERRSRFEARDSA